MSLQTEIDTHSADKVCLVCLLRPYLLLGIVTGIVGYSYSCPHLNKSVSYASFHHSSVVLVTALVLAAVCVISTSYNAWYIIHHESEWYSVSFLVYQIHACLLQLSRFWSLDESIKEYTGLAALVDNCQLYGVEYVYSKKAVKDDKFRTTIIMTGVIFVLACITICRVILNGFNVWQILTTLIQIIHIAGQLMMATSYVATFRVYVKLMQVCYAHIKQCLNGRIAKVQEEYVAGDLVEEHSTVENKIALKQSTIITSLQKLQRMHLAIMTNFEQTIDVISLNILTVSSNYTMVMTLTLYTFITRWWSGTGIPYSVTYLFVEAFLIIIFVPWVLYTVKRMNYTANDVLDFLENFPINRLNAIESAQVEAIIITVRSVRPSITASGLFDMDIGVYCSALIVVISYFLLALQFQASWLDK